MPIKVKPEFSKKKFGFNGSYEPLGKRDDLHLLLADAKASGDDFVLSHFEDFTDKDIKTAKEEYFNKKQAEKEAARKKEEKVKPAPEEPKTLPNGQPIAIGKDTTAGIQEGETAQTVAKDTKKDTTAGKDK